MFKVFPIRLPVSFRHFGSVTDAVPNKPQGVTTKTIPGGRLAVLRHVGSYEWLGESVYYLYPEAAGKRRGIAGFSRLSSLSHSFPTRPSMTSKPMSTCRSNRAVQEQASCPRVRKNYPGSCARAINPILREKRPQNPVTITHVETTLVAALNTSARRPVSTARARRKTAEYRHPKP